MMLLLLPTETASASVVEGGCQEKRVGFCLLLLRSTSALMRFPEPGSS